MPKVLFNQDAIDLVMQICTNAERYRWSHAGSEDQITVDTLKATASLLAHRTEQTRNKPQPSASVFQDLGELFSRLAASVRTSAERPFRNTKDMHVNGSKSGIRKVGANEDRLPKI